MNPNELLSLFGIKLYANNGRVIAVTADTYFDVGIRRPGGGLLRNPEPIEITKEEAGDLIPLNLVKIDSELQ